MASAPWRCSECGTINEPVANSCRTCGRWPSLFDLQASVVEDAADDALEPDFDVHQATTVLEPVDPRAELPVEEDPVLADEEVETESERRRRLLTSLIVPAAFVVYLVVSIFANRGG